MSQSEAQVIFSNMFIFYNEQLLASHPTPKLEDDPLSTMNFYLVYTQLRPYQAIISCIRNIRVRCAALIRTNLIITSLFASWKS
jgi:hypothetical protein